MRLLPCSPSSPLGKGLRCGPKRVERIPAPHLAAAEDCGIDIDVHLEAAFWSWVGSMAANLADDLEPPTGPKHRGYLHSWEALALATAKYDSRDDLLSKVLLRAYASHLADDSRTTAGLPLATIKFLRAPRRRF